MPHAPLAEAPHLSRLVQNCPSAVMTTSVWDEPAPHHTTKVMMAPHIANGHDGMMGGHPSPMHHKQRPPPLKTCAELPKSGMTTSVGGEQAPHHTTKVMMAPNIANGHDGMMGGHPCPMHH